MIEEILNKGIASVFTVVIYFSNSTKIKIKIIYIYKEKWKIQFFKNMLDENGKIYINEKSIPKW